MELFLFLSSQSEQSHEEGQQSPGLIDIDNDDGDDDVSYDDNIDLVIGP